MVLSVLIARILSLYLSRAKMRLGKYGMRLKIFELQLEMKIIEIIVRNLRFSFSIFSGEASILVTIIPTGVTVVVREMIKDKIVQVKQLQKIGD